MRDGMNITDKISLVVYDTDKNIVDKRVTYDNTSFWHRLMKIIGIRNKFANDLVTSAGVADLVQLILDRYNYMSVGTGVTAPEVTDTQLESEVLTRATCTKSVTTTFYTNDTVVFSGEFTPSYDVTISECGIHLNSTPSGDIMFARETFVPVELQAGYTTMISWQIILTR